MSNGRTDFDEFAMMAGHVRIIAETMLAEFFGQRCPDFEKDCECCQRWKFLDDLTANPFAPEMVTPVGGDE